jgi:DNA-binding NarL/FixJ family response regulator
MTSTFVAIIEPQRIFAPFLMRLLSEAGFSIVATLDSLSLDEIARAEPNVIFIDLDFIDVEPLTALRQLRLVAPNATVCVYTGRLEDSWAAACSRAGANCIVSKLAAPHEIAAGIKCALRVGAFIDHRFDAPGAVRKDPVRTEA